MKTRSLLPRLAAIPTLLVICAVVFTAALPAHTQSGDDSQSNAPSSDGAALGTGLISLVPGHSARVAAVNVGGKDIQGEFIFVPVTEQGKASVPIRCNWFAAPGDAASDTFTHPGGANVIQFYAQVRVRQDVKDLNEMVPSLQIFDDQTGKTEELLSGADFASFRPDPGSILIAARE